MYYVGIRVLCVEETCCILYSGLYTPAAKTTVTSAVFVVDLSAATRSEAVVDTQQL
jgi:hypothetical protein